MARIEEVRRGEVTARDVVDGDRAVVGAVRVDHHHRRAAPGEQHEPLVGPVDRRDEHPLDPLLLQQVEVRRLAAPVLAAVAEEHRQPDRVGGLLHALRDVGEERVARVEHDVRERAAAAAAQLASRLVAHEAQLRDRGQHALPRALGHHFGTVQDVRDRADGDPRMRGDVLHAR